jgi:two-component system OmpR family response regulator
VMGPRVLIVEDDAELRGILVRGLAEEGFRAEAAGSGADLLRRAVAAPADALVVDIGLPDTDGRDLCQALRAQGVEAPVLFLTARAALVERLSAFRAGGDDYLTKPFAFAELVARLHALVRRSRPDEPATRAGLRLDPTRHAVSAGDTTVALTPTEFRLLGRLLANTGEVVRRRELVRAAWPEGARVHDNTLDAYISRLRRKLRELGAVAAINTAHGVGYSLE